MEIRYRYWLLTSGDIRATAPDDNLPDDEHVEAGPFGSQDDAFAYLDTVRGKFWINAGWGLAIVAAVSWLLQGVA